MTTSIFTSEQTDRLAGLWAENDTVRIFMLEDHGTGLGSQMAANRIEESMALGYRIATVTGLSAHEGTRVLIFMTRENKAAPEFPK